MEEEVTLHPLHPHHYLRLDYGGNTPQSSGSMWFNLLGRILQGHGNDALPHWQHGSDKGVWRPGTRSNTPNAHGWTSNEEAKAA